MNKHPMKTLSAAALALWLGFEPLSPLWAQSAQGSQDAVTVDDVVVGPDTVTIKLSDQVKFKSFLTQQPPRLVIELLGADYQAAKKVPGQGQFLKSVRGGQFQPEPSPVSRVVLDLNQIPGYQVSQKDNDLVVTLGPATQASGPAPAAAVSQAAGAPKAPASASDPDPDPSAPADGNTPAAAVEVQQAAPTSKDAQAAGSMSTSNNPELLKMALSRNASSSAPAPAAPIARPAQRSESEASEQNAGDIMSQLPRDRVTLDFDDTDLRDIIKLLAAKSGLNIIYGPDVDGTLTLHLSNVPFDEAFRTVLAMSGLTTTQIGDHVLRVLTPAALAKAQTSTGLVTRVFPLNYAKAANLVTELSAVRTAQGLTGTAQADATTNSVIITESPEGLTATERLIKAIDVKPQQVLIEAKLVEVGLNNSLNYGIQWDYTGTGGSNIGGQSGQNYVGTTAGPLAGTTLLTNPLTTSANTIPSVSNGGQGVGATGRGTGVNLPASTIFGALTLGRVTNNYILNATLSAAASEGKVKVLSDPKIATLNNQAANINVTTQSPYVTSNVASTGVQTQTVNYVTTGIQLSVTPTINADGRITLQISPNVSQPSATAATNAQTGAIGIDTRQATTTVLVNDGDTIVIGGLISDSVSDTISKIPVLGDIPLLGWLFKSKSVSRTRAELLIFVTPKIMNA